MVGKPPRDLDVERVCDKYRLDDMARKVLAEVMYLRKDSKKEDLADIEAHLEGAGRTSVKCMMLIGKLRNGEPLPPVGRQDKGGGRNSYRDRDRDRRSRSRERYRGRSNSRGRR